MFEAKTKKRTGKPQFLQGTWLLFCFFFFSTPAFSQGNLMPGVEIQAYPAGIITSAQLSYIYSEKQLFTVNIGLNTTDRRDWGEHDNEEGSGSGFGLGWRHYFRSATRGFNVGVRTDVWFLSIDWIENVGAVGTTDITVVQPTAQLGYSLPLKDERWIIQGSVSLGAEINVQTEGEPVGEGAILLAGVSVGYRL